MPGFKGLAVPGPTNMPFEVRAAMDVALEDHRAPDFPNFVKPLMEDLKKVFLQETGHVFIFPSSGTGGWESAIANTLSPGDKVLVAVFGQFSHLWADLCERFGLEVEIIDTEWGMGAPIEEYEKRLAADTEHKIKACLICHNETATGVTSDVKGLRDALDRTNHPALLFVDGVSSIGSLEFRMEDWRVDVAVSGSQKGFMLPTGLAIVAVSDKAIEAGSTAKHHRCFFDYQDMIKTNAQGYFPYTPAVTLMRGLRASLDLLLEEGMENVWARHHRLAEGVRAAVAGWGLTACAKEERFDSDTVTAIVVPDGYDANDVIKVAYERYGLSLGAGLSKVAGKVFRIGHLGWMNELMVLQAVGGAELAMIDAGLPIEAGTGTGAAVSYFAQNHAETAKMAAE